MLSDRLHCDPFKIMEQNVDDVILFVNYFIDAAGEEPVKSPTRTAGPLRVHVTDATATGGWF